MYVEYVCMHIYIYINAHISIHSYIRILKVLRVSVGRPGGS